MGKRSSFPRKKEDAYFTPYAGVLPLLPYLQPKTKYIEPCAGDGRLIRHLAKHGHECIYASDINPQAEGIEKVDILFFDAKLPQCEIIISNFPWHRDTMHKMIEICRNHATTWMLADADWMFTKQAKPYLKYCDFIISVGRISWEGNGVSGKDNCAWYRFQSYKCETIFKPS